MVGMDGMIHGFGTLVGVMVGITGVGDDLGDGITVGIMAMAGTTGAGTLVGVMAGIIGAGMVTTEATDMLTMQEEEVQ